MEKQRVTVRDVAQSANVSASAVSLVLNGRPGVSTETRDRILRAVVELGYPTRAVAETEKPQTVGLIIEKTRTPGSMDIFYSDVIAGFQAEAQRVGTPVMLHMFDRATESLDGLRTKM